MTTIQTKGAPEPIGPYSQAIEIDGFVLLSGQIGLHPETGQLADGLTEQTDQAMKNISAILQSSGLSLANVVKSTIYLKNISNFVEFNKIYAIYFKESPPARTTVEVSALPRNALVEIDIIAHK